MEILDQKIRKTIAQVVLCFLLITIISCDKNENCCAIVDVNVGLHYKDKMGNNLINSNTQFDENNIKIYFKNKNKFEYINRGNLDAPKMFSLNENELNKLILTVFPSDFYDGNQSTTLIELNPNVVDTLVCEFDLGSNRTVCKRAWLNGTEMNNWYLEVIH